MTPWEKFKKKLAEGVAKAELSVYNITGPGAEPEPTSETGQVTCGICSGPMERPPTFRGKPTGDGAELQCKRCDRIPRGEW